MFSSTWEPSTMMRSRSSRSYTESVRLRPAEAVRIAGASRSGTAEAMWSEVTYACLLSLGPVGVEGPARCTEHDAMDTADPNEGGRRLSPDAPSVRSERHTGLPPASTGLGRPGDSACCGVAELTSASMSTVLPAASVTV